MAEKIYIDQGHNPRNPNSGAEGNGLREQDLVYTIGVRLSEILRAGGLTTRLSRPSPTTQLGTSVATSLAARVNDANSWGADYFISLHTNASSVTTASGSECFVYSEASPGGERGVPPERGDRSARQRRIHTSVSLRIEKDGYARRPR